jgi:tetratricopeptide (TPR) repeat protein
MIMKANTSRDERIDAIRRRFGITLTAVSRYNSEYGEEIKNSSEIFSGKDEEKTRVLLYMMSSPDDKRYNSAGPLVTQYGTMLIAALIYNPNFYAMAENYRGAVNAGFAAEADKGKTVPLSKAFPRRKSVGFLFRTAFAAAAVFAVILCIIFLVRAGGAGQQISNDWIAGLTAPQRPDGVSFVSAGTGARIGIKSPLMGTAMASDTETADITGTVSYYTKAIRAEKSNATLYVNRGVAYTLGGYIDSAIKDFNKAVELDPDNTSARFNRSVAYTAKGSAESAVTDLLHIITVNPGDSEAYYTLGSLYLRQYELDNAKPRGLLEKALEAFSHIQGYKDADIISDIYSRLL